MQANLLALVNTAFTKSMTTTKNPMWTTAFLYPSYTKDPSLAVKAIPEIASDTKNICT